MENRGDADAGAEVLGVGGDGDQGLGRCLEQQVVDDGVCTGNLNPDILVVKSTRIERDEMIPIR